MRCSSARDATVSSLEKAGAKPLAPTRSCGLRHGFTLIELLVIIAVIAIMTAFLFPIFASIRARGRQTVCLSNLRQIGVATLQYAQDSDDCYPYMGDPSDLETNTWQYSQRGKYWLAIQDMKVQNRTLPNVMSAYVKDPHLWRCPADSGFNMGGSFENIPMNAHPSCFEAYGTSYVYTTLLALDNQTLSNVRAWSRMTPYSPHDPVDIPLFHDHVGRWHGGILPTEERFNEVMLDGHAVSISREREEELDSILFTVPNQPTR